uniref:Subtelomeric sfi--related protein family member, putative n=1 Tax=Theileria annulata TaxID=5874 RepID=A0A3B0ND47_THEAN
MSISIVYRILFMMIAYLKNNLFVKGADKLGENEREYISDGEDNFEVNENYLAGSSQFHSIKSINQEYPSTRHQSINHIDIGEDIDQEYDPKLIHASELDIKSKISEHHFDYNNVNNNLGIYRAKDGSGFRKVKQNKNEIWNTTYNEDLACTVIVHGVGSPKKVVTIFTLTKQVHMYKKSGKNKPWEKIKLDVFGKLTLEDEFRLTNDEVFDLNGLNVGRDETYNRADIKILADDPSNPKNSIEVDPLKVNVKKYILGNYLHEIDDDVTCKEILIRGVSAWKYNGDEKLRKFRYQSDSNMLILLFNNCLVSCHQIQSGNYIQIWHAIPPLTLFGKDQYGNKFQLNEDQYRIDLCRYSNVQYIFNGNVKCTEVRFNDELVWKQEPGLPHATQVRCLPGDRLEIMFGKRGYIFKRSPEVRWFTDYHIVPEVKTGPIMKSYRELM